MSDASFREARDLVYKLSGIYYSESKKGRLETRVLRRMAATKKGTYEEYISFIKSIAGSDELGELLEAVTINETYFFRAPSQFDAFEKIIVPQALSERQNEANPVFRVWSAASSTGEEAYTIALVIKERLCPIYPNVQFQIVASDINKTALETARKGIYKDYSVKNVPAEYLKKYFLQSGNTYVVNDEIRRMVKFMNINLYDRAATRQVTGCDVIFCANMLIYFDLAAKQQVVSSLYNSLSRGGYLFIGYSESLHGISKAFELVHLPKAMAYRKGQA